MKQTVLRSSNTQKPYLYKDKTRFHCALMMRARLVSATLCLATISANLYTLLQYCYRANSLP